jgi:hypothetical protein
MRGDHYIIHKQKVSDEDQHDGVPRMKKLRAPLMRAQGYQRFPLSKPAVGQNIALDAVSAYRASIPTCT